MKIKVKVAKEKNKDVNKNKLENYFVDEVMKKDMTPSQILNWYRNLYYKESDAEHTIIARAINDYFCHEKSDSVEPEIAKLCMRSILSLLDDMDADLSAINYEDLEANIAKGNFIEVFNYINYYIKHNNIFNVEYTGTKYVIADDNYRDAISSYSEHTNLLSAFSAFAECLMDNPFSKNLQIFKVKKIKLKKEKIDDK